VLLFRTILCYYLRGSNGSFLVSSSPIYFISDEGSFFSRYLEIDFNLSCLYTVGLLSLLKTFLTYLLVGVCKVLINEIIIKIIEWLM
jgi:hypothetical protein